MRCLFIVSVALLASCSRYETAHPDLPDAYAEGRVDDVSKILGNSNHQELLVSFPVSVNANIKRYLDYGDAMALNRAKDINIDYYSHGANGAVGSRDSLTYAELIQELESGNPANFGYICIGIPGFSSNILSQECSCRSFLVNDALRDIGAVASYPHVERALWVAESSSHVCKSEGLDWIFVVSLLNAELYSKHGSADAAVDIGSIVRAGESTATEWACALRAQYLDYASSNLADLEDQGVLSCENIVP